MPIYQNYRLALKNAFASKQKHFLNAAKHSLGKSYRKWTVQNVEVKSYIRGKRAGEIEGRLAKFPKRLQETVGKVDEKYADLIFAESQRLVPVDKKYIGKFNVSDVLTVQRSRVLKIPQMTIEERRLDIEDRISDGGKYIDEPYYSASVIYKEGGYKKIRKTIEAGTYTGSNANFIKEYLRSSNKRKRHQLFTSDGELFGGTEYGGKSYASLGKLSDIKPENVSYTSQLSGGNQELKRSGLLSKDKKGTWTISYNPINVNSSLTFNYAQLQHDMPEPLYTHKVGESMYLYKAFEKYRQDYIRDIGNAINNAIKENEND